MRLTLLGLCFIGCLWGCLSGCSNSNSTGSDGSSGDHDLLGRDLSQPTTAPQVRCGGNIDSPTLCTTQASICCSADDGTTGTCVSSAGACPAGVPYQCDEPANCQGGQVCCQVDTGANMASGGSSCQSAADCSAKSGIQLCLKNTDCSSGQNCCPFAVGGKMSYSHCSAGICPGLAL